MIVMSHLEMDEDGPPPGRFHWRARNRGRENTVPRSRARGTAPRTRMCDNEGSRGPQVRASPNSHGDNVGGNTSVVFNNTNRRFGRVLQSINENASRPILPIYTPPVALANRGSRRGSATGVRPGFTASPVDDAPYLTVRFPRCMGLIPRRNDGVVQVNNVNELDEAVETQRARLGRLGVHNPSVYRDGSQEAGTRNGVVEVRGQRGPAERQNDPPPRYEDIQDAPPASVTGASSGSHTSDTERRLGLRLPHGWHITGWRNLPPSQGREQIDITIRSTLPILNVPLNRLMLNWTSEDDPMASHPLPWTSREAFAAVPFVRSNGTTAADLPRYHVDPIVPPDLRIPDDQRAIVLQLRYARVHLRRTMVWRGLLLLRTPAPWPYVANQADLVRIDHQLHRFLFRMLESYYEIINGLNVSTTPIYRGLEAFIRDHVASVRVLLPVLFPDGDSIMDLVETLGNCYLWGLYIHIQRWTCGHPELVNRVPLRPHFRPPRDDIPADLVEDVRGGFITREDAWAVCDRTSISPSAHSESSSSTEQSEDEPEPVATVGNAGPSTPQVPAAPEEPATSEAADPGNEADEQSSAPDCFISLSSNASMALLMPGKLPEISRKLKEKSTPGATVNFQNASTSASPVLLSGSPGKAIIQRYRASLSDPPPEPSYVRYSRYQPDNASSEAAGVQHWFTRQGTHYNFVEVSQSELDRIPQDLFMPEGEFYLVGRGNGQWFDALAFTGYDSAHEISSSPQRGGEIQGTSSSLVPESDLNQAQQATGQAGPSNSRRRRQRNKRRPSFWNPPYVRLPNQSDAEARASWTRLRQWQRTNQREASPVTRKIIHRHQGEAMETALAERDREKAVSMASSTTPEGPRSSDSSSSEVTLATSDSQSSVDLNETLRPREESDLEEFLP